MDIPALVYEHALLQNVEFEWGTWARPVKTKPQVCGRDLKHFEVKFAEEYVIQFESAASITEYEYDSVKCKIVEPDRVNVSDVETEMCKKERESTNIVYKNSKFYCKTCNENICNNCFTTECMDHVVQWLGNATFTCDSASHKAF